MESKQPRERRLAQHIVSRKCMTAFQSRGPALKDRTLAHAEKDRQTRTLVDGQSVGAATAPVTGLHFVDGPSGLLLYVVTEKQTSVIDLASNQLAST